MGLGAVAAASIGAGVLGAGASIYGSSQASKSANKAADVQQSGIDATNQRYATTRGDLQPYFQPGYNALNAESNLATGSPYGDGPNYVAMAYDNLPGRMTQAQLEATPGYQFTLGQGLKAVQSAAAARGLGVSGAALKGAGDYATGLANKTYLDQFNVGQQRFSDYLNLNTGAQGNITNQFNRLNTVSALGENAAAGLGATGASLSNTATTGASNAGNYINAGGLASAAGGTGVGNAITGAANNYLGYNALQNLMGNNQGTGGYITTPGGGSTNMPLQIGSGDLTNRIQGY
jgi:hypothetical protein